MLEPLHPLTVSTGLFPIKSLSICSISDISSLRKVNRLAHYALTSAAIENARTVTIEHLQAARAELAP